MSNHKSLECNSKASTCKELGVLCKGGCGGWVCLKHRKLVPGVTDVAYDSRTNSYIRVAKRQGKVSVCRECYKNLSRIR